MDIYFGLTEAFQKEKHDTASQLLKEYAKRNWSSRWLNLFSEKLINSVLFGRDVAQLACAVIVQFSGVARSQYLNMR